MSPMTCCRYCVPPKRYPGCHDHCPERIKEKAEYDMKKADADRKKAISQRIYAQKEAGVIRANKRHGKNRNSLKE